MSSPPKKVQCRYELRYDTDDGVVTIERLCTITPACVTNTHYQTVTRTTKFVPTTVATTEHFSRTTTITNFNTRRTTVTLPTTITRYTTTTSPYYAACATDNILLNGPGGHTIANVFNNGRRHASSYEVAQVSSQLPYECCAACQKSGTCEGSVFNPEIRLCLLLRREDRTCGPQCNNPVEYITDPENRGIGLAVSNGQCGYLYFGGAFEARRPTIQWQVCWQNPWARSLIRACFCESGLVSTQIAQYCCMRPRCADLSCL